MKTLEQIKEEYAIVYCQYPSWEDFINDISSHEVESHMNEIAKIYATEYAKESLRLASENVRLIKVLNVINYNTIDKESILSENNLPKHI